MRTRDFTSDAQIHALVAAFENRRLPKAEFRHSAHIAVGLAYLASTSLEPATQRMRASLRRFLDEEDAAALHETMTVFWMKLLHHLALAHHPHLALWEKANAVIASHGTRWPVDAHYSKEALASVEARRQWVEPNLLPLPF
jgi:hypothetical protein